MKHEFHAQPYPLFLAGEGLLYRVIGWQYKYYDGDPAVGPDSWTLYPVYWNDVEEVADVAAFRYELLSEGEAERYDRARMGEV